MLNAIIQSSLNNRFFVLILTTLIAGTGVYSALHLAIDAVPDLTNVQVQVITEAPALSPLEVDSLLSFPVSGAMSGLPEVEQIRSISKFGVSGAISGLPEVEQIRSISKFGVSVVRMWCRQVDTNQPLDVLLARINPLLKGWTAFFSAPGCRARPSSTWPPTSGAG